MTTTPAYLTSLFVYLTSGSAEDTYVPPPAQPITIPAGETGQVEIQFVGPDGQPVDLTGCTAVLTASLPTKLARQIDLDQPTYGVGSATFAVADTSGVRPAQYAYDIVVIRADGSEWWGVLARGYSGDKTTQPFTVAPSVHVTLDPVAVLPSQQPLGKGDKGDPGDTGAKGDPGSTGAPYGAGPDSFSQISGVNGGLSPIVISSSGYSTVPGLVTWLPPPGSEATLKGTQGHALVTVELALDCQGVAPGDQATMSTNLVVYDEANGDSIVYEGNDRWVAAAVPVAGTGGYGPGSFSRTFRTPTLPASRLRFEFRALRLIGTTGANPVIRDGTIHATWYADWNRTDVVPYLCNPIGDSITDFGGSTAPVIGAWRQPLFSLANNDSPRRALSFVGVEGGTAGVDGPSPPIVDGIDFPLTHDGISSTQTIGFFALYPDHLTRIPPGPGVPPGKPYRYVDACPMMLGTNDWLQGNGATWVANYLTLIDSILGFAGVDNLAAGKIRLFVASCPPFGGGNAGNNAGITAAIPSLQSGIASRFGAGKPIHYVPVNEAFLAVSGFAGSLLIGDGIHPNATGMALIASTFYSVMRPFLPQLPSNVGLVPLV